MESFTQSFINTIKNSTMREMKRSKILASLIIAQAIIESGWGLSGLTKKANNLFGMKTGRGWTGEYIILPTSEFINGKWIRVEAKFRKYTSWENSIIDHTNLLFKAKRYKNLIGEKDYKMACKKIHDDGYATSPNYATTLKNIIEQYKLYQFDDEVLNDTINENIGKGIQPMDIKILQKWLNENTFTDSEGNKLKVDGVNGDKTKQAISKAKETIEYVLKSK